MQKVCRGKAVKSLQRGVGTGQIVRCTASADICGRRLECAGETDGWIDDDGGADGVYG